jgi:hypothetical protein
MANWYRAIEPAQPNQSCMWIKDREVDQPPGSLTNQHINQLFCHLFLLVKGILKLVANPSSVGWPKWALKNLWEISITYMVNEIYGSHQCESNYLNVGWKKQFLSFIWLLMSVIGVLIRDNRADYESLV